MRADPRHRRRRNIHRLPPPHELIPAIDLDLDGAADLQGAHGRPHAPLPPQDPMVQTLLCRHVEQLDEVGGADVRHEGQAGAGDVLVDEEAAERGRERAERVQLVEAMVDF